MATAETITKKQVILETAARLFREKGFASTTMRDIGDAAGMLPSSLYNHIKSKQDILQEICLSNAKSFTEGMKAIRKMKCSPSEQLTEVIALHVRIATEDSSSSTVFSDEWKQLDPEHLKTFLTMRRKYEKELVAIIKEGIDSQSWQAWDTDIAVHSLLSSLRWVHEYYKPGKMGSPEKVSREMANMWLHGLEKKKK